jgi:ribosomal protein S27E
MATEGIHTDGNAVAGLLQEVFAAEITAAERVCDGCGQEHAIGAHRAYTGAGTVLRCPGCGAVAATVAELPGEIVVAFSGAWKVRRVV